MEIYMVGAKEIDNLDVSLVRGAVEETLKVFVATRQLTPVDFGISAYDNDQRALFDILEVRRWCAKLYQEIPFILSMVTPDTLRWLFLALGDIEVTKRTPTETHTEFRPGAKKRLINEMMSAQNGVFMKLASTEEEFDRLSAEGHQRMMSALVG